MEIKIRPNPNEAFPNPKIQQTLFHLVTETKARRMFGEWNDYGRLLDY
jgi:hypothetical protein